MSNFGFGFGPTGDGDDLSGKIPLFAELQKLLSGGSGPVNWDLARQLAISALAANHRTLTAQEKSDVAEALRLADLWLDSVTDLPSGLRTTNAWTQVEWVEKTIATWAALCDPIATRVVAAISGALPAEIAEQAGPLAPMMSQFGGLMFGAQLGQGLSQLAAEVVSSTDVGLPMGPPGAAVLLPANVAEFARTLELSLSDTRLFLAVREAAYQRLFGHVPWLRQQLLDAVDAYGRGIHIDPEAISSALTTLDPADPESLQQALSGGMFQPANSQAQDAAPRRLATLLALIEGWVDAVTLAATDARMGSVGALSEAVRRRRASGGPAEQIFATLVGLELRPRQLREAAALWTAMSDQHGTGARDSLWNHPDLLPSATDLDDPLGFVARYGDSSAAEIDGLSELLDAAPSTDEQASSAASESVKKPDDSAGNGPSPSAPPGGEAPEPPSAD